MVQNTHETFLANSVVLVRLVGWVVLLAKMVDLIVILKQFRRPVFIFEIFCSQRRRRRQRLRQKQHKNSAPNFR